MIEEIATVTSVNATENTIAVEVQRQSSCGGCQANKACGTAVIGKALGRRRSLLTLNYDKHDLRPGDNVVLGLSEQALVRGSLAVYAVPLLCMLGFAIVGDMLGEQLPLWDVNNISACFSLFGLFLGLLWLKFFSRSIRNNTQYQPVVLRKQEPLRQIQVLNSVE